MEPRLAAFGGGRAITTLNVRSIPGTDAALVGQMISGDEFRVNGSGQCLNGLTWYSVTALSGDPALEGYIAEGADGSYFVEPITILPTATPGFEAPPLVTPVALITDTPLPAVNALTTADPDTLGFVNWEWPPMSRYGEPREGEPILLDPFTIVPPEIYAGDMPDLPVDLSNVAFVTDAGLNSEGLALLGQNGFVVTTGGFEQFDEAYFAGEWSPYNGYSVFVTTDSMLHSFYLVFENLLTYLEQESLYPELSNMVARGYRAAEAQVLESEGTALEEQARAVAVYYAVALQLLAPAADETVTTQLYQPTPADVSTLPGVDELVAALEEADASIRAEAQPLVDSIVAGEGQGAIPFLSGITEDFGIYHPRGHYTISPLYERYFRAVTWLGRITFRAAQVDETQQALLTLRALLSDQAAADSRQKITDVVEFLIGPEDNLGPAQYTPLAQEIFGDELSLDALADSDLLAQFQARLEALPPPAINTTVLPPGVLEEELDEIGRGFRLLGQRFTIDANILQQVIDPYIQMRTIPTALDVPAALGSDTAFVLSLEAGASEFSNYESQIVALRNEVNDLAAPDWLANIYSGWLWTLQPFFTRSADSYPPLMNTDAWMRHDLQTGLASYTELKHATILYTAQPMGGRGGGGELPVTYGYVEPNPLVFARTAIIAEALYQGLLQNGYIVESAEPSQPTYLSQTHRLLRDVSRYSAYLADLALRELNGEEVTQDDHDFIQYAYTSVISGIRSDVQIMQSGPPQPAALVTDIASNGITGEVLQLGTGGVDYIYVVIPTPNGLQLARGAVYSYYEFVNQEGQRLTDEEWRGMVAGGNVPARPDWINAFFAD